VEVASGGYFEVGGGVRYVLSQRAKGALRAVAIRGDGRIVVRSNAFNPTGNPNTRTAWAATGGISVGF
jgi:hypothetical protein